MRKSVLQIPGEGAVVVGSVSALPRAQEPRYHRVGRTAPSAAREPGDCRRILRRHPGGRAPGDAAVTSRAGPAGRALRCGGTAGRRRETCLACARGPSRHRLQPRAVHRPMLRSANRAPVMWRRLVMSSSACATPAEGVLTVGTRGTLTVRGSDGARDGQWRDGNVVLLAAVSCDASRRASQIYGTDVFADCAAPSSSASAISSSRTGTFPSSSAAQNSRSAESISARISPRRILSAIVRP